MGTATCPARWLAAGAPRAPGAAAQATRRRARQAAILEDPVPVQNVAEAASKHQNITYELVNGPRHVRDRPIDLDGALSEMDGLSHGIENFMCITNHGAARDGFVQFLRLGDDRWYADIPIDMGRDWSGYVWGCETATRPLVDTLRLFFEEAPWFGVLPWTMRKAA